MSATIHFARLPRKRESVLASLTLMIYRPDYGKNTLAV